MNDPDTFYMAAALKEAQCAFDEDEVPVGAVIVHKGRIIGKAHNQIKLLKDPTAHAEIIAITQAATSLGNERLLDTTIYVTIEPCAMCAGAMVLARIQRLVFAASDPKTGAAGSVIDIVRHTGLNHRLSVTSGICAREASSLVKAFFAKKRAAQV